MKLTIAILAVLALVGSAMAWEINDNLQYAYTKSAWQEAGSDYILPAFIGATSDAHFSDPGNPTMDVWSSAATVSNKVADIDVNTYVRYPNDADLGTADFAMTLTQGGSAEVALHSMINDAAAYSAYQAFGKQDTPEMSGTATAYQNLNLAGGFGEASAEFNSQAAVGVDNDWTVTALKSGNSAWVDSNSCGGGAIESANLGAQVHSDIVETWPGTGWATPQYSGGIKMWADFTACDPGCSNPIIGGVDGSFQTSIFPGNGAGSASWGGDDYWGSNWESTSPF